MDILSYVMGLKAGEASGGGGDDPDIVRFSKDVIAPEQTVTVSDDEPTITVNPKWEEATAAIDLEKYDLCLLTVDGTENVLSWGINELGDEDTVYTAPNSEGIVFGVYYDSGAYGFIATKNGANVDGDYTVEFSKLVPVTE